jgi:hypothetical protein
MIDGVEHGGVEGVRRRLGERHAAGSEQAAQTPAVPVTAG